MTAPDQKALDDLIKAALVLFVMLGEKNYLTVQTKADNPEIGADEVVELTITRTKIIPPWRPLSDYAGVTAYEVEGVAV